MSEARTPGGGMDSPEEDEPEADGPGAGVGEQPAVSTEELVAMAVVLGARVRAHLAGLGR